MTDDASTHPASPVFRIDRFAVPPAALPTFLDRLRQVHQLLEALPGCRQSVVLTRSDASSEFNVVTIAQWADEAAAANARGTMQAHYRETRFDPGAFMEGLGVRGDLAAYRPVDWGARR